MPVCAYIFALHVCVCICLCMYICKVVERKNQYLELQIQVWQNIVISHSHLNILIQVKKFYMDLENKYQAIILM